MYIYCSKYYNICDDVWQMAIYGRGAIWEQQEKALYWVYRRKGGCGIYCNFQHWPFNIFLRGIFWRFLNIWQIQRPLLYIFFLKFLNICHYKWQKWNHLLLLQDVHIYPFSSSYLLWLPQYLSLNIYPSQFGSRMSQPSTFIRCPLLTDPSVQSVPSSTFLQQYLDIYNFSSPKKNPKKSTYCLNASLRLCKLTYIYQGLQSLYLYKNLFRPKTRTHEISSLWGIKDKEKSYFMKKKKTRPNPRLWRSKKRGETLDFIDHEGKFKETDRLGLTFYEQCEQLKEDILTPLLTPP